MVVFWSRAGDRLFLFLILRRSRQALQSQLTHASRLVREAAVRWLGTQVRANNATICSAIEPLLDDPVCSIRQMRKAIEWGPNSPPFHHDLAILLSMTGDSAGAVKSLREAVHLDSENPEFHYKLALALSETGTSAETISELEKTVKLDPRYARAWYNLGLARTGTGQQQEAIAALL